MDNKENNGINPAVIITGSSGYLGSDIIKRLSGSFQIYALDKAEPRGDLPEGVEYHHVDLTSDENVQNVIGDIKKKIKGSIASVIHLAAYYDFSGEPSDLYEQLTVQGTARLIDSLKDTRVDQFLFTSTLLVHAPCEKGQKINENWPLKPKWDYPQSKVEAENVIKDKCTDIPAVILRIAGVYDDSCHSIPISNQIQRIYEKRITSHVFPKNTDCGQPYLHQDDLVEAVIKSVQKRNALNDYNVFLIGEPDTYTYAQLQEQLGRLIHGDPDWTTQPVPKPVAKAGAFVQDKAPGVEDPFIKPWMVDIANDHVKIDISKAKELLDWEPQYRLINTLSKMIDYLKRDPAQWYKQHKLKMPEDLKTKETIY